MELGLFSLMPHRDLSRPPKTIYDETVALVRDADQGGFDVAWFAEHHFGNYCMCPSPLMMASHCAGVTDRIKLGAAVLVLPLYHPMRVVQELGMVDMLSNGRLVIGLGSGYQTYEFDRFGVKLAENWAMTHEFMDILEMGLETGTVTYDGHFYKVPETHIGVRMLQKNPRVFVAGNQAAYLERAARKGYTPIVTVGSQPIEAILRVKQHVASHFAVAGWRDDVFPFGMQRSVFVTDDKNEALHAAEQSLYTARLVMAFRGGYEQVNGYEIVPQPFEGEPTPQQIVDVLPMGDVETCAERIVAEITAVKPSHYSFFLQYGALTGAQARRSLERLIGEVLPLVDKAVGGLKQFGPGSAVSAA